MFAVQLSTGEERFTGTRRNSGNCLIVTCLIPHSSPCSMNKVRGTCVTQPLCLLYGTVIFPGHVTSFHGVRKLLLLLEAIRRLENCVFTGSITEAGGQSVAMWSSRGVVCVCQRSLGGPTISCQFNCLGMDIGRLRLWSQNPWA